MNARARATSWIGGDRVRATVLMLVERGGHLRFEAEVSLQGTVSILATDDGTFQLLDVRNNQLRQGPACPANVASLIRMPLAPGEVAAILLGDVQLPAGATPAGATVTWDAEHGADALGVKAGGLETRVLFRPDHPDEIVGASASGPEGPRWRASYEDFGASKGGPSLPGLIRFAEGTRILRRRRRDPVQGPHRQRRHRARQLHDRATIRDQGDRRRLRPRPRAMTTGAPLLSVRHLTTVVDPGRGASPLTAVGDVSFDVARGRTLGIVGESGSGKSLTAMSILRLLPEPAVRIAGGEILFEGEDLARASERALRRVRGRRLSMVFQEPSTALNPVLTIGDQVGEPLRIHEGLHARGRHHARDRAARAGRNSGGGGARPGLSRISCRAA